MQLHVGELEQELKRVREEATADKKKLKDKLEEEEQKTMRPICC
jgi:hypothetical protein